MIITHLTWNHTCLVTNLKYRNTFTALSTKCQMRNWRTRENKISPMILCPMCRISAARMPNWPQWERLSYSPSSILSFFSSVLKYEYSNWEGAFARDTSISAVQRTRETPRVRRHNLTLYTRKPVWRNLLRCSLEINSIECVGSVHVNLKISLLQLPTLHRIVYCLSHESA